MTKEKRLSTPGFYEEIRENPNAVEQVDRLDQRIIMCHYHNTMPEYYYIKNDRWEKITEKDDRPLESNCQRLMLKDGEYECANAGNIFVKENGVWQVNFNPLDSGCMVIDSRSQKIDDSYFTDYKPVNFGLYFDRPSGFYYCNIQDGWFWLRDGLWNPMEQPNSLDEKLKNDEDLHYCCLQDGLYSCQRTKSNYQKSGGRWGHDDNPFFDNALPIDYERDTLNPDKIIICREEYSESRMFPEIFHGEKTVSEILENDINEIIDDFEKEIKSESQDEENWWDKPNWLDGVELVKQNVNKKLYSQSETTSLKSLRLQDFESVLKDKGDTLTKITQKFGSVAYYMSLPLNKEVLDKAIIDQEKEILQESIDNKKKKLETMYGSVQPVSEENFTVYTSNKDEKSEQQKYYSNMKPTLSPGLYQMFCNFPVSLNSVQKIETTYYGCAAVFPDNSVSVRVSLGGVNRTENWENVHQFLLNYQENCGVKITRIT